MYYQKENITDKCYDFGAVLRYILAKNSKSGNVLEMHFDFSVSYAQIWSYIGLELCVLVQSDIK